jgi:dienelactone hydrolase
MSRYLGLLLVLAASTVRASEPSDWAKLFAYDTSAPLEPKLTLLYERAGVKVYDLLYPSPRSGMVPGYLVVPAGSGPFAGLVFGHWGPGNRTEFLSEAEIYAQAGAVSVMIDYPWVRPAPWRVAQGRGMGEPEKDRDSWTLVVVDLRRAFDVLLARPGVDKTRVGYVGHSYGAQWGAILTAVDRRMKATVLVAGVPTSESLLVGSDDPDVVALLQATPKPDQDRYFEINRPFDAIRFVPHATPIPLFFQFARHERALTEAAMKSYFDAASEPKTIRWYETGHELNDLRALADRAAWLERELGLKPTRPLLQKRLESDFR